MVNWYFYCLREKKPEDKSVSYFVSRFELRDEFGSVLEIYNIKKGISLEEQRKVVARINLFLADKKTEDNGLVEKVSELLKEAEILE